VNHGENGMPGEHCIEGGELSSAGIGPRSGHITVDQDGAEIHDSAHGNRDTDQREKDHSGPQRTRKTSPWLHVLFYAESLNDLSIL